MLVLNILLAIIPSLILVRHFYRADSQRPEPKALILKTFLLGFFSVIPALFLELFIQNFEGFFTGIQANLFRAFIVAAVVEEGLKLFVVRTFIFERKEFDEVYDGMVYTITASLGFACFENIMYSFGSPLTILLRGFSAVPLHAFASGIMGYYVGKARYFPGHWMAKGFLWAVVIHGAYDFFLFTGGLWALLIIPLLVIAGIVIKRLGFKALEEDRRAGRS